MIPIGLPCRQVPETGREVALAGGSISADFQGQVDGGKLAESETDHGTELVVVTVVAVEKSE